jgi:hypothetical protein
LAQFQPSPVARVLVAKLRPLGENGWLVVARLLLAKVPIALKRAVGLSGPSTGSAPLPTTRLVERFFAWIQWQRRILVRWEYHAHNFTASISRNWQLAKQLKL